MTKLIHINKEIQNIDMGVIMGGVDTPILNQNYKNMEIGVAKGGVVKPNFKPRRHLSSYKIFLLNVCLLFFFYIYIILFIDCN